MKSGLVLNFFDRKHRLGKHLRQGDVPDLNILVTPAVEQLDGSHLRSDVLGQDLESPGGVFDLDFPVVRHVDAVCTCCRGRAWVKGDGRCRWVIAFNVDNSRSVG